MRARKREFVFWREALLFGGGGWEGEPDHVRDDYRGAIVHEHQEVWLPRLLGNLIEGLDEANYVSL